MALVKILEVKFDNPEWLLLTDDGDEYLSYEGAKILKSVLKETGRGDISIMFPDDFTDNFIGVSYSSSYSNEPRSLFLKYRDRKLIVEIAQIYLKNGVIDPKHEPFFA